MANKLVTLVPTDWVLVPSFHRDCFKPHGGLNETLDFVCQSFPHFFRNGD